jgi:hypothetical protein
MNRNGEITGSSFTIRIVHRIGLALSSCVVIAGCSAILGFDHGRLREGEADDAGTSADGDVPDPDAGLDATTPCVRVCVVVNGLGGPGALAADATYVYWGQEDGTIWRARQDGTEAKTLLASGHPGVSALAISGTTLFYTDRLVADAGAKAGSLGRIDTSLTNPVAATILGDLDAPTSLALSGTDIFLTMGQVASPYTGDGVSRVPQPGSTLYEFSSAGKPVQVVVDGTTTFWADPGGISRKPKTASKSDLAYRMTSDNASSLAQDDADAVVYYTVPAAGTISSKPKNATGGAGTVVFSSEPDAGAIAAAGTALYWIRGSDIMRGNKVGGGLTTVSAGQRSPQRLAVTDTFVFWTNRGSAPDFKDGNIVRARR